MAFFDLSPDIVPPLDFFVTLPPPSRRRPLQQRVLIFSVGLCTECFLIGTPVYCKLLNFWGVPVKIVNVKVCACDILLVCADDRITGQMSVLKCPLVTFSPPLSHDPTAWDTQMRLDAETSPMLHNAQPHPWFLCFTQNSTICGCRDEHHVGHVSWVQWMWTKVLKWSIWP